MQVASLKQSVSLLSKDKDFYAKQLCQVETKLQYAEDRVVHLNEQLDRAKQSREDLFNEHVTSRSGPYPVSALMSLTELLVQLN